MAQDVSKLPVVAITMGDAAGIGPEIIVKALSDGNFASKCHCIIVGDHRHLVRVASDLNIDLDIASFDPGANSPSRDISIFDLKNCRRNLRSVSMTP